MSTFESTHNTPQQTINKQGFKFDYNIIQNDEEYLNNNFSYLNLNNLSRID